MPQSADRNRPSEVALLLFSVGAIVFVSRARFFWATGQNWLLPFALWLGLVGLAAWTTSWRRKSRAP
jgi:hypothetical protein